MDVQVYATVGKDFGNGSDGHPYHGDETQCRQRTYLVEVVLQRYGGVYQGNAGIHYDICQLEEVLSAGVAAGFVARFAGRTVYDNFHAALLGFQCHVYIDGIDTGM